MYQITENGRPILAGRVALVTGGSGGIGSSTAKLLAHNGATVVVHYNSNKGAADAVVSDIVGANGRAIAVSADLTSKQEVAAMFHEVGQHFDGIDILVANAGIFPPDDVPVDQMPTDRIRNVLATTVEATMFCAGEFFGSLRDTKRPGANMIIIGSTSGLFGEAGHVEYSAAKAALVGITKSLGNEITRIVSDGRVNLVAPGWLRSGMTEQFIEGLKADRRPLQTRAITRIGRPEDTANAVLYFASSMSSYVTKTVLEVSGGMEGRVLRSLDEVNTIPDDEIL